MCQPTTAVDERPAKLLSGLLQRKVFFSFFSANARNFPVKSFPKK